MSALAGPPHACGARCWSGSWLGPPGRSAVPSGARQRGDVGRNFVRQRSLNPMSDNKRDYRAYAGRRPNGRRHEASRRAAITGAHGHRRQARRRRRNAL